jgi:hypothetical protein
MLEVEWNSVCPFCRAPHEVASCVGADKLPKDGDLSLCFNCGEWGIFTDKVPGKLRKPTDDEYARIAASPTAKLARMAWGQVDERRRQDKQKKAAR